MNPADLTQTLEALTAFAKIIDALGIPGIVGLVIAREEQQDMITDVFTWAFSCTGPWLA